MDISKIMEILCKLWQGLNSISWQLTVIFLVLFCNKRLKKVVFDRFSFEFQESTNKSKDLGAQRVKQVQTEKIVNIQFGQCLKKVIFYDTCNLKIPKQRTTLAKYLLLYKPFGFGGYSRHILFYFSLWALIYNIILMFHNSDFSYTKFEDMGIWCLAATLSFITESIIDHRHLRLFSTAFLSSENPMYIEMKSFQRRFLLAYCPHNILGWFFHFIYYVSICCVLLLVIGLSIEPATPETFGAVPLFIFIQTLIYSFAVIVDGEPRIVR